MLQVMGRTVSGQPPWPDAVLSITPVAGCVTDWGQGRVSLLYSPKIPEQLVPRLWRLAQERKVPMTHLVRDAVVLYLTTLEGGQGNGEVNQDRGDGEDTDTSNGRTMARWPRLTSCGGSIPRPRRAPCRRPPSPTRTAW